MIHIVYLLSLDRISMQISPILINWSRMMKPIFPAAQVVVDEPMEKGKENVSSANPVLSSCT